MKVISTWFVGAEITWQPNRRPGTYTAPPACRRGKASSTHIVGAQSGFIAPKDQRALPFRPRCDLRINLHSKSMNAHQGKMTPWVRQLHSYGMTDASVYIEAIS